jgi:hypothetical protein
MLETALEMQEKFGGDMNGPVAAYGFYLLGVSYFRLKKYPLSEGMSRMG